MKAPLKILPWCFLALFAMEIIAVLVSKPDGVTLSDTNLLFYYQNRLAGHGLAWDVIAPPGMPAARPPAHVAAGGAA